MTKTQNLNRQKVNSSLCSLVAYYIQKQQTVVLAMLDINPMALMMGGQTILGISIEPYIQLYHDREANIEALSELSSGIWKEQWKFKTHGIGCKLINITTSEPLQWDAPASEGFRFSWFKEHLQWRLQHDSDDPHIHMYLQWQKTISSNVDIDTYLLGETLLSVNTAGIYFILNK